MPLNPSDILFTEIYQQLNSKFHNTALFYEKLESKKEKTIRFAFVPDRFSHLIMATVSYETDAGQLDPGYIGYEIRRFSPRIDSQKPGGHLELEIKNAIRLAEPYCLPIENTLDSAFVACIQCEMALRSNEE